MVSQVEWVIRTMYVEPRKAVPLRLPKQAQGDSKYDATKYQGYVCTNGRVERVIELMSRQVQRRSGREGGVEEPKGATEKQLIQPAVRP